MNNIVFEEGYKEFAINNDESRILRFNPTDLALFEKIKKELSEVQKFDDDTDDVEADRKLRETIDKIFYEGASVIIFKDQNVLTTVNGVTIFERFFKALLNIMKPYVEKEARKTAEKIEKYRKQHDRIIADNSDD